jgi:hypothetical protein
MAAMIETPETGLNGYIPDSAKRGEVRTGSPLPLGTQQTGGGVNFDILSRDATRVRIELFDHHGDALPARSIDGARGAEPLSRKARRVYRRGQPHNASRSRLQVRFLEHSERRQKPGESDAFINQKVRVALAAGLDVIFCVCETLEQREANQTEAVLDRQLIQGLANLPAETLPWLSIAYEPIWAIGSTGHHAIPQQAQETHTVNRRRFGQMFEEESAQRLVIQYGGSVKPENAASLFAQPGVDGGLIGGASLKADQFLAIVQAGITAGQSEPISA